MSAKTYLESIYELEARIAELEEKLWRTEQESEQAVNRAAEMIEHRDNRIAELEAYIQKIQAETVAAIAKARKEWAREDLKALAIRDLEQRARGVEGYIARRKLSGGNYCSTTLMYMDELYEQAKALKESK